MKEDCYLNSKAKVKASLIHKRGVFAKKLIKKSEIISASGGSIVTEQEYRKLQKKVFKDIHHYATKVADGLYLAYHKKDLEADDFFNHSCNPNAGIKGHLLVVAIKDVKPGEEITYDYAMTDFDENTYFKCNCGAKNCRKIITGNDWKKPALQKRYQGYFSWYIQEKIYVNI